MKKRSKLILVLLFISIFLLSTLLPNLLFADTRSDIEAFVTRFYNFCLDRNPDQPGLENWVGHLQSGRLSGADVAERFIFSEEFLAKNLGNEEFLNIMYRSFFGREPDPEGYAGWLAQLRGGMSRKSVLARFVNSTEFGNLCSAYGIKRGTIKDTDKSVKKEETAQTAPTGAEIPILIINDLGKTLSLSLSGPASYSLKIPAGRQNIYVIPGIYNYTGKCSGVKRSGTKDLSESGGEWRWWWSR